MLGLPTKVVSHLLVGDDVPQDGDVAVHPRLIYVDMFVFTHRLDVDRRAAFAPGVVAIDSERALSAVLAVHTRAGLPPSLLIFCSYGILFPLCLETYRAVTVHGPGCAYPTSPLLWHPTLNDPKACSMAPAGTVIASY